MFELVSTLGHFFYVCHVSGFSWNSRDCIASTQTLSGMVCLTMSCGSSLGSNVFGVYGI